MIIASDFEIMTRIIVLPLQFAAAADIRTSLGSHMRVLLVSLIMNRSLQRIRSSSTSNTSRPSPLIDRNKIDEKNEAGIKQRFAAEWAHLITETRDASRLKENRLR